MKHYKYLKPYIRRVNGKEIYDGDVRVALRLAVFQKYKTGYVIVLHGFPNEAIAVGASKSELKKIFGSHKFLKNFQDISKLINIEVNHEDRSV